MLDAYGRKTEYLRLSVTEKCNLSCIYCKSKLCANPTAELSADEFGVIIQAAVSLGMTKLRLTGGEPLMRRDLERIIASASTAGFKEISLTTNAQGFSKRAADLKAFYPILLHSVFFPDDKSKTDTNPDTPFPLARTDGSTAQTNESDPSPQ